MAITSANRYLTRDEMEGNAEYIAQFFLGNGWTLSAVAAMLGNMESESTINPGIYENLNDISGTAGFGLVQWTPATKYTEWADANGYGSDYGDIRGQVARIQYEMENGLQWIPTVTRDITFEEFAKSNASPEELAWAFLMNYERPANTNQPERATQARAWFNYFENNPNATVQKGMNKILLYFGGTHRRR